MIANSFLALLIKETLFVFLSLNKPYKTLLFQFLHIDISPIVLMYVARATSSVSFSRRLTARARSSETKRRLKSFFCHLAWHSSNFLVTWRDLWCNVRCCVITLAYWEDTVHQDQNFFIVFFFLHCYYPDLYSKYNIMKYKSFFRSKSSYS